MIRKGACVILLLKLNPANGVPLYLQLIEQVKLHIATGTLKAHDELPSVRAVAGEYLINPNTVARGYRELEQEGIIYKRRGMGTYVAEKAVGMGKKEKARIVSEMLQKALVQAAELGLDTKQMRRLFDQSIAPFEKED